MGATYLQSDFTGTGSATGAKATYSFWVKPAVKDDRSTFVSGRADASNYMKFRFANDSLHLYGNHSGSNNLNVETNRKFRDPAAWYHIVLQVDTTSAVSSDRVKFYVNNEQQTSFSNSTYPSQNDPLYLTSEDDVQVGAFNDTEHFDGQMSQFYCIDGTLYAPSTFAETDSTSGFWVAKTSVSVTYGSKGYFLKFASGSPYADSSGNSNDFTLGAGTLISLKDTPDNNFCTMNPLDNYYAQYTYSNANQTITNGGSKGFATGTFALRTGKWYWEMKPTAEPGGAYSLIGIADVPTQGTGASNYLGYTALEWAYYGIDGNSRNNTSSTSYGDTWASGDIIGVYLDLDNNKLYFAKNGTIQNSGTGISITAATSTATGYYFPATGYNDTSAAVYNHNLGQGYFGTTAVTSGVADAGGEGTFEYDPSSGTFDGSSKDFRAICTNNLTTYG